MSEPAEFQILSFQLGGQEYAIRLDLVQSIERVPEITYVLGMPSFVRGVINLRGHVLPVVDLHIRLNLQKADDSDQARVMIMNLDDKQIGVLVDAAHNVLTISTSEIETLPEVGAHVNERYVAGIISKDSGMTILLDMEKILSHDEMVEFLSAEV